MCNICGKLLGGFCDFWGGFLGFLSELWLRRFLWWAMIFWLRVFSESRFSGLWFLGFAGEILFGLCRYFLLLCSTFFFSQKKKVAKKSCVFLKWNSPHECPRVFISKLRSRAFIQFKQHFSWWQLSAEVLCLRQGGGVCLHFVWITD
jgi:hypothetical protein